MDERVDGQHLKPLDEPGSDELLSDEAKERIREAIEYVDKLKDAHGLPDRDSRTR